MPLGTLLCMNAQEKYERMIDAMDREWKEFKKSLRRDKPARKRKLKKKT